MGRVYCSSDWHGCAKPAKKLLNYLNPDDVLFFLGDAADRGPDGKELLDLLLNDPRVRFIQGNHEDFFVRGATSMTVDPYHVDDLWLYSNGGEVTWRKFLPLGTKEIENYIQKLKNLPLHLMYKSPKGHKVILDHSGFTPDEKGNPLYKYEPLWDREHFYDDWGGGDNLYLVHGHTPVQYLKYDYSYKDRPALTEEEVLDKRQFLYGEDYGIKLAPEVIRYCDGHKFDIDLCTIVSGRVALLDLDTFNVKYFE